MITPSTLDDAPDFSLVLGGPIYQWYRRTHLSGPVLELLHRRVLFFILLTWLPPFLLSIFSGHLLGNGELGFLRDIETQTKFLVAIPMLLIAELFVHKRIPLAVKRFIKQRIVTAEDLPRFHAAIESATRLRNSMPLELALCLLVWTAGIWFWRNEIAQVAPTWYGFSDSTGFHLRPAGYWNVLVSIPIVQLLLLRWYLKLFVWFSFLWHVSRLNLNLWPSHPDRSGGLGFLGTSVYSFSLVLVAQGAIMCGTIANGVLDEGQNLMSYRLLILTAVAFFVVVILGPLTMFTPHLTRAKRNGLAMYGNLATDYVMQFEHKWLGHGTTPGEVLGTGDIQSLADLGNSYAVVREMRFVPFGVQDITRLVVTTAAPLLPLLLIVMPLEEMVMRVLKSIF